MAVDKDKRRRAAIDPGVNAHFGDIDRSAATGDLKERAKRRASDEKRQNRRTSWDIDPEIKAIIVNLANGLETSQSQVVSYLIVAGLHAIKEGVIPAPEKQIKRSKALKFANDLEIPFIPERDDLLRHRTGSPHVSLRRHERSATNERHTDDTAMKRPRNE